VGKHRDLKFGVEIDRSESQPTSTNCPWKGRGHVTWLILNS